MNRPLLDALNRLLGPIKTRLANSIARAVISNVTEGKGIQLLQLEVLAGEDIEGAERLQGYGFNSVPRVGAEAVVIFPNGDRAHGLVVAVDDRRYRPKNWLPGEVGLYTDEAGHTHRLRRGKISTFEGTKIELGEADLGATTGAVNGEAVDPYTGMTQTALGNASSVVFVKKA